MGLESGEDSDGEESDGEETDEEPEVRAARQSEAMEKKRALAASAMELFRAAHGGNLPELRRLATKWSGNEEVLGWAPSYPDHRHGDVGDGDSVVCKDGYLVDVRSMVAS